MSFALDPLDTTEDASTIAQLKQLFPAEGNEDGGSNSSSGGSSVGEFAGDFVQAMNKFSTDAEATLAEVKILVEQCSSDCQSLAE